MASRRNYYGNIRAPEFPADAEWLNTGRPLSLAELRGKLVLLDFWTYGCINCIHIIPDLKRLEALYSQELVVIGVHSAKFANEGDTQQIRQIVLRYDLEHPIVNDRDYRIWNEYAVRAWPTAVLIDPRGYVLAAHSGEGVYEAYKEILPAAIQEYDAAGLLDRRPLDLKLEREGRPDTALSFPGKVLADEDGARLFIADSNHHRIVMADLDGRVLEIIGSGARGLCDGAFDQAQFAKPQGMALAGERLYVADTENHVIRLVDLGQHMVSTIAGDGSLGRGQIGPSPRQTGLNSPWDLTLVDGKLYIAMAGLHQLWVMDLRAGRLAPHAGSGREGLLDAPLPRAALAQPSGITSAEHLLYFADSEASAIRSAPLDGGSGEVKTIIGEGLFEFGDVDGQWPSARLQHALGVSFYRGVLYVADTYNHKIKVLSPETGYLSAFLGSGEPGWRDGLSPRFYEPGGLSAAGGKLYIADTNNHAIRVADLDSRHVSTLRLQDPRGLLANIQPERVGALFRVPEQQVRPGPGVLRLQVELPLGYKINDLAPSHMAWQEGEGGVVELASDGRTTSLVGRDWPLDVPATFHLGQALLRGDLALYYCAAEHEDVCLIRLAQVEVPVTVRESATSSLISVALTVPEPR